MDIHVSQACRYVLICKPDVLHQRDRLLVAPLAEITEEPQSSGHVVPGIDEILRIIELSLVLRPKLG